MINDISISNVERIDKRILIFDNGSLLPRRGILYIEYLKMSYSLHRSGAVIYCEHQRRFPDDLDIFNLKCIWIGHREGARKTFIFPGNTTKVL